jgi:hypothetical protein
VGLVRWVWIPQVFWRFGQPPPVGIAGELDTAGATGAHRGRELDTAGASGAYRP